MVAGSSAASGYENAAQTSANAQLQMFNEALGYEKPGLIGTQEALAQYLYSMGLPQPTQTTITSGEATSGPGSWNFTTSPGTKTTDLLPQPAGGFSGTYGQYMQPFNAEQMYGDPGYQFRLQQGLASLNAQGAASGQYGSGNLGIALQNYGQQAASQEYQSSYGRYVDTINRMAGLAGQSSQIAQGMGGQAVSTGAGMGNALMQGGTNYTNAMMGLTNQIGSLGGNMMNYGMLSNLLSGQSGGSLLGYGGGSDMNSIIAGGGNMGYTPNLVATPSYNSYY
jgi:hypothetical protein